MVVTVLLADNLNITHYQTELLSLISNEEILSFNDSIILNQNQEYRIEVEFLNGIDDFSENRTIHICCELKQAQMQG